MEMKMNTYYDPKDGIRVNNIIRKAGGWNNKAVRLAENMAAAITKGDKALRRARAAEIMGNDEMARIFRDRAKALGMPAGAIEDPKPATPEYEIKIKHLKFVEKEAVSARPCVFFWKEDTTDAMDLFLQRFTPKEMFLPLLDEVLEPIGMTCLLETSNLRRVKAKWSQFAGCRTCPCSPGFVLNDADGSNNMRVYKYDIHVHYMVVSKNKKTS
jgi:hypothetical protein